jgi:2-polyprenyl-3-methyl-5-hydroxy-6-metoxy-1,4-benzoquinol methylase
MKTDRNLTVHKLYDHYTTTSQMTEVGDKYFCDLNSGYFRAHFAALLPSDRAATILEVGCGCGRYLRELLEMGYTDVYGIDISEEQIEYARRELCLSIAEKADAVDWLGGKDAQFDCILALDVLEHLETDYLLTLGESIYSSLKPGGRVLVQVPNGVSPLNDYRYGDLTHVRAFTTKSMRQFFLLSGLTPVGYHDIPPIINGVVGFIRRVLWSLVLKPTIGCYMIVANGSRMGGIYTPNFLAVAQKD